MVSAAAATIILSKGASLGKMTRTGIPVPPGFVVLAAAFDAFLKKTDLTQELEAVLKRCFGDIFVRERIVKRTYPSVIELLSRIKYTGSRGCGNDEKFLWLKRTVNEIEEIYRSMYGQIEATYQIFFCKALK